MEQHYPGRDDEAAHFAWARQAFEDPRYQCVDGKPVFVVFAPHDLPSTAAFIDHWRELAHKAGYPEMYFVAISNRYCDGIDRYADPILAPFDAVTPLTPHDFLEDLPRSLSARVGRRLRTRNFGPLARGLRRPARYDYADVVSAALHDLPDDARFLPGVLPDWDNTPRSGVRGVVFEGTTPELFAQYLGKALARVRTRPREQAIVFLKAWNEWAEGNLVEPDAIDGHAYLDAIRRTMLPAAALQPARPHAELSA